MLKKTFLLLLLLTLAATMLYAAIPLDRNEENCFDRKFIYPYNASLDKAATITDLAFFVTPAAFLLDQSRNESVKIGVMYAETLGAAFVGKEILKRTVDRARPYLYTGTIDPNEEEWYEAFPSGHTTGAFATASFTTYVFAKYYPASKWKLPVAFASYGIATAEAVLRIKSGCHFPTDVLAGAALGTALGFGIPMLHTFGENVEASVSPFGLLISIDF